MTIKLVDVYSQSDASTDMLYRLLEERAGNTQINISHLTMPPWEDHCKFVLSHPYAYWYIIVSGDKDEVGAVYITRNDEIGIFIFRTYQGRGYGPDAIKDLMSRHPRDRYLANINPLNKPSIGVFTHMGFDQIQSTYEFVVEK